MCRLIDMVNSSPISTSSCDQPLGECLTQSEVPIKLANDPDWDMYSQTFNIRLPYTPAVIVIPESEKHIQDAVICASQHEIKVQAKSGGHSYASYSNGGVDGAMMIDLQNFQKVEVDAKTGVAKVGAGARLGNVALAIYAQGKRAVSHGTCAGVGIGGHFTHGGYGFSSRAWGLAMDHIVALDVVLADGRLIRADQEQNEDVYWAMRGAADSFGIVTNFYVQTRPAPEQVVNFSFVIPDAAKDVESAVSAFKHIQDFSHNDTVVDRNLGLGMGIGKGWFTVQGTYFGSLPDFNSSILPEMLRGLPEPSKQEAQEVDWPTSLQKLNEDKPLNITGPYTERSNFFAKSVTVKEPGMTQDALESYMDYVLNREAPIGYFILVDLYGGSDSQINIRDESFSAFSHRNDMWVAQHYGYADENEKFPDEGIGFMNGLNDAMTKHLPDFGAYDNYVDPSLTRDEAHDLYYGEKVYKRLKSIKEQVDANNVFANPQSI